MCLRDFSISVVIPTHNRASLIGETIKSVLAQTHQPAEIIVVDDGSSDRTRDIVRAYPATYLYQSNEGPGIARNVGVAHVKTPWVAFCDDDDLWRPTYLEAFKHVLTDESVCGLGNSSIVRNNQWEEHDKFSEAPNGFFDDLEQPLYRKLVAFNVVFPSAVVARKNFINAIGHFVPELSHSRGQDYEFVLRCNERGGATVLHSPLVGIRKHEANRTNDKLQCILGDIRILAWARRYHRLGRALADLIGARIAQKALEGFDQAFVYGDKQLALDLGRRVSRDLRSTKFLVKRAMLNPLVPGTLLRAAFRPAAGA